MTKQEFIHLHVHSEYSILDGSIKIKKLVKELAKRGATAVALTDHDVLCGALEFYLACQSEKINGILGYEINLEPRYLPTRKKPVHLILLAENEEGYANLIQLCTIANTVGQDRMGSQSISVTWEELSRHKGGLICLTSCLLGALSQHVLAGNNDLAKQYLNDLQAVFGSTQVFVELIDNGLSEQKSLIPKLVDLASLSDCEIVATADAHYLFKEDKETHASLLAIKNKLQKTHVKNMPDDVFFHMPTTEEMCEKFAQYPKAIENTVVIANRCQVKIDTKSIFMPNYSEREGESADECLLRLSQEGLETRKPSIMNWQGENFNDQIWEEYKKRLEYELSVIIKMKFSGYFLIVQDFINWAKNQKIPVGPGRGSAAGSLVTYALQITNIDPIRFNLLFERFLNPERISMPDIDTDFCQDRREEVLQYVYQKYGRRAVSQIVTFGRMMARNAIKNLARINGWSFHDSNEFVKYIPETPGITLEQAYEQEEKLRDVLEKDERARHLWEGALEIEGTLSSLGIHAAGVIISDRALDERCPLLETEGQLLTQFEHKYAEKIGLIKFDFLGLKTLTVIDNAVKLIKKSQGKDVFIDSIDLDDPKVYEHISTAHVTGIFQLESTGMRKLIADLKPTCFTDIIAVLALFRPGPLGSGMVDDFVKRKHGLTECEYFFKELEPILKDTYGVIVYQEQVQKIAAVLANYSLGEADLLRRAMGKKDKNEMERQKSRFVEGATKNGHDARGAGELFDLMAKFAEYGFNKSHTAAYGFVTYQTAWLKTYFPTEFMSSIMSCDIDNTDKIVTYIRDCRRLKINVLPPCVNYSEYEFSIHKDKYIRYALGAIKGLGKGIIDLIIQERQARGSYTSVPEFIARIDARKLNKKAMESLVKSGAFDSLATNRAELWANVDIWLKTIGQEQGRAEEVVSSIFDLCSTVESKKPYKTYHANFDHLALKSKKTYYEPMLLGTKIITENTCPEVLNALRAVQVKVTKPWHFFEYLAYEANTLGFYMSGHPADMFKNDMDHLTKTSLLDAVNYVEPNEIPDHKRKVVTLAGIVTMALEKKNKDNQAYLVIRLEDGSSDLELTLFHRQYAALSSPIQLGACVFVEAKLRAGIESGSVRGVIQSIVPFSNKRNEVIKAIVIHADENFLQEKKYLIEFEKILLQHKGNVAVFLKLVLQKENAQIKAKLGRHAVTVSDEFIGMIENFWPSRIRVERCYTMESLVALDTGSEKV